MLTFDGSFLPEGTYATPQATIGVEATLMQHQVRMNVTKKTPTYYAVMHYKGHTTNVFVKGGFKTLSHSILYQYFVDELKPLFGLAKIGTHIALMHTGKHQQTEYFLIMRDFGPGLLTIQPFGKMVLAELIKTAFLFYKWFDGSK